MFNIYLLTQTPGRNRLKEIGQLAALANCKSVKWVYALNFCPPQDGFAKVPLFR